MMTKTRLVFACAALLVSCGWSDALSAESTPPVPSRRLGPCTGDLERLCPTVQSGKSAILECLSQHEAELSPACQAHLKAMNERRRAPRGGIRGSCRTDIARLCAGGQTGGVRACLREHLDQLAPSCRAALERQPTAAPNP